MTQYDFTPIRHGNFGWEIRQSKSGTGNLLVRWLESDKQKIQVGREGSGVGGINPLRHMSPADSVWLALAAQTAFEHQSRS